MTVAFPEIWLPVSRASHYEVSDRGHIRRRPKQGRQAARLVRLQVDSEGYQNVTLIRGQKQRTLRIDELVCQHFHGNKPNKHMAIQHIDGVTWNDWASNLRWEYPVVANQWYGGPIDPARRGLFRFGPFASKLELVPHLKYGDIMVAFGDNQIKAFEFVFGRDTSEIQNPFNLARYWRATVNSLTQVERCKGMDMPADPNLNPYEAAESYRKLALMHPEFMWANYLLDAAFYIERMADCIYKDIPLPANQVVPSQRRPMAMPRPAPPAATVQAPAAPVTMARRPMGSPTVVPPLQAPPLRRRTTAAPGLFNDKD